MTVKTLTAVLVTMAVGCTEDDGQGPMSGTYQMTVTADTTPSGTVTFDTVDISGDGDRREVVFSGGSREEVSLDCAFAVATPGPESHVACFRIEGQMFLDVEIREHADGVTDGWGETRVGGIEFTLTAK